MINALSSSDNLDKSCIPTNKHNFSLTISPSSVLKNNIASSITYVLIIPPRPPIFFSALFSLLASIPSYKKASF